jgi:geranylgeranyl pyrophosphate synthase
MSTLLNDSLTYIENSLEQYKLKIEKNIKRFIENEIDPRLRKEAEYVLEGGKRLRGATILLLNELLSGDEDKALRAATAIEIVHSSSLAIDDIIDMDIKRRGRDAAWVTLGIGKTTLITNVLIPKAVEMVTPLGERAVSEVLSVWSDVSRGEILDSYYENADYMEVVELKTSRMYELAFVLGALSAGREEIVETMREAGKNIGILYQILDDYIDTIFVESKGEIERVSLERFHRWIKVDNDNINIDILTSRVKTIVDRYLRTLNLTIQKLPFKNLREILTMLPYYIIQKQLGEAGLSLDFSMNIT